jgi:hypothetical protein
MTLPPGSSSLVELDLSGENIPLQYLKHLLRLPKALRVLSWRRHYSREKVAEDFVAMGFVNSGSLCSRDTRSIIKRQREHRKAQSLRHETARKFQLRPQCALIYQLYEFESARDSP